MSPSHLVRKMTLALCLTLAVTAQPRLQGSAASRPVISLDSAQYCIGDSWKFTLSNGVPNTPVRLLGSSSGQSWEITEWGKTDADGNFSEAGTFPAEAVGNHTLKLDVGGTKSNTISFVVSDCRLTGRIAFVSTRDGEGAAAGHLAVPFIYVANPDGSGVKRLTRGASPAWSADGKRIAFHSWIGGTINSGWAEIRVINADGSNERVLGPGGYPSWSPDGTKIVFHTTVGSEGGIFMMNADGSGVTQLVSNEFANPGWGDYAVETPSWSPDGGSISFVRANYEDPWTVHLLDLAKSEISLLSIGRSVGDSRPAWSPDGTNFCCNSVPGQLRVSTATAPVSRATCRQRRTWEVRTGRPTEGAWCSRSSLARRTGRGSSWQTSRTVPCGNSFPTPSLQRGRTTGILIQCGRA